MAAIVIVLCGILKIFKQCRWCFSIMKIQHFICNAIGQDSLTELSEFDMLQPFATVF